MSRVEVRPSFDLYESHVVALIAAAKAAKAPVYGMNLSARHGMSWGLWTDRDKAELIAEGLRLTGYTVVVQPGYSVGVIITGPSEATP